MKAKRQLFIELENFRRFLGSSRIRVEGGSKAFDGGRSGSYFVGCYACSSCFRLHCVDDCLDVACYTSFRLQCLALYTALLHAIERYTTRLAGCLA